MFWRNRECFKRVVRLFSLRFLARTLTPWIRIGFSTTLGTSMRASLTWARRTSPAAFTSASSTLSSEKRTGPKVKGRGQVFLRAPRYCLLSWRLGGPSSCSDLTSAYTFGASSSSSSFFLPFFVFFFLACYASAARRLSSAAFATCFLALSISRSRSNTSARERLARPAKS